MGKQMGLKAAADYCRRFGMAFHAGIDIVTLCRTEARHGKDRQRVLMSQVADQVAKGTELAEAMQQVGPKFFPNLMIAMVRLGEQTGRLERTMLQLADHYQHRLEVRKAFLTAIAWPLFQLIAAVMIIGVLIMILGILPNGENGKPFDPLGLGLAGASGALVYFLFVGFVVAILVTIYFAVKNNWLNLHALVPIVYLAPKVGPSIQTITIARFTWTLSMALDAGLDPFRAIDLAMDSTGSDYYRAETEKAHQAIRSGDSLAGSLAATELFPQEYLNAVDVAELSGTTSESIGYLAQDYDARAKLAVKAIAVVFSMLIWFTVIGILVFLILSMAMRVFKVYDDALSM